MHHCRMPAWAALPLHHCTCACTSVYAEPSMQAMVHACLILLCICQSAWPDQCLPAPVVASIQNPEGYCVPGSTVQCSWGGLQMLAARVHGSYSIERMTDECSEWSHLSCWSRAGMNSAELAILWAVVKCLYQSPAGEHSLQKHCQCCCSLAAQGQAICQHRPS